jgi:competence protein ComEA
MIKQTFCALALCLAMALPAFAATPVNVNKADAQTIATSLDGVGLSKAQAIVAYRDAHGPFKSVDDLGNVKGIGAKTLDRNREAIHLTGGAASTKEAASKPARIVAQALKVPGAPMPRTCSAASPPRRRGTHYTGAPSPPARPP